MLGELQTPILAVADNGHVLTVVTLPGRDQEVPVGPLRWVWPRPLPASAPARPGSARLDRERRADR